MRTVRTYWWNEQPNFGDAMNPLLMQRLFGVRAVWDGLPTAELIAAGSVIQWVTPIQDQRVAPIHVWGSGFIFGDEPAPELEMVRYAAFRGARSARHSGLDAKGIPLGDPGLLASLVVDRPARRGHIGFVPHLWHQKSPVLCDVMSKADCLFIDVADDPQDVVSQIAGCRFVFSSSLHGLVVADSYGIPNCWITLTPALFGGSWKFDDYYSSFGIAPEPRVIEPGFDVQGAMSVVTAAYNRQGLANLQKRLLDAFPFR